MGDEFPKSKVAVAQAASVFLDREGSVARAIELIEEAGKSGVDLVAFPEGFIPAHPIWYHMYPATSRRSLDLAAALFANAVTIPGPAIDVLCDAAARANVHVVMGVCEKLPDKSGTMYNTLLYIHRQGYILGRHRKLVPTVGERLVHGRPSQEFLDVFDLDIGRISGLLCGENSNPLSTFALDAQGTQIHVASWPSWFPTLRMEEVVEITSRSLAYRGQCYVLNACGIVSQAMLEALPQSDEDRELLADPAYSGGSSIIGPNGRFVAGPMPGTEEGLLTADVDVAACVRRKLIHDFTGHYNRSDVFSLSIRKNPGHLVRFLDNAADGDQGAPMSRSVLDVVDDAS